MERSSARTTATEIARADGFTNKQKYQRKENILRTSLSKAKGMWQTSKQIIGNINQTIKQNVQTKAPIRAK